MIKELTFDNEANDRIKKGINKLAKAVKSTLGPKGRNVIIERDNMPPLISKDGITVAQNILLADKIENIGAQAVIEAAAKTADAAGDGTTTATVLTEAIYTEGLKYITAGYNPIFVKRGIDKAVNQLVEQLKIHSKPIETNEEIKQIATVSANWDEEIGNMIAEAMKKVGADGVVTVEESKTSDTTLSVVNGMQFDRGYISPYFINEEATSKCIFEDCLILLYEKKLNNLAELLPVLQQVGKSGKPLLIVAEDIEGEVLSALIINKMRGSLNCCAVKAPGFGDRRFAFMEDIAVSTGAKFITADLFNKLEDVSINELGVAKKVIITKDTFTIIEGKGDKTAITNRINRIRNDLNAQESIVEKEKYKERLAKLAGGVAVINLGANTEPELKEKKMRIDDALAATKAAVEEGISVGGSVALIKASLSVEENKKLTLDEQAGWSIVMKAIESPIKCLCENAGLDGAVVLNKIKSFDINSEYNIGFNVATSEYADLIKTGVIDPTKVARLSLQNAASIAGLLLTSSCVINKIDEVK